MTYVKETINYHFEGLLNSYAMVFFSKNRFFAWILLLVSFFDPIAGISGLISVLTANTLARIMGFNKYNIQSGFYGFNALLVGLGIGVYFQFTVELMVLVVFAALLTLFITIVLEGVIGKYGLPYLTIAFLISFWLVTLAARYYTTLYISERGIYQMNEMYNFGGPYMISVYKWFDNLPLAPSLVTYFKSLSAIFFQYHLITGMLVAIGLLYYSRIAFLLSLIGFYAALSFYAVIGANFNELNYSFIGFNYILTAIAIGGFFIISSRTSFLWVILLTPLISVLVTSTSVILGILNLSTFSLPFNITVLLFIYALKLREKQVTGLQLVGLQEFSPERNLYSQRNNESRFPAWNYIPVYLPVMGEWTVTQGHSGEFTHQKGWRHAWDLEITDDKGRTFTNKGLNVSDYYCYRKPVMAPADGWVEEILDLIEDNPVGQVNLSQNWGNTIIIRHSDFLYTKICHLRKDSFKVKVGATVKKGEILALCGSSGRSPVPHVHFQIQSTAYIGSHTMDYPISQYLLHNDDGFTLHSYARPALGDKISDIKNNLSLCNAFHFTPGQTLDYEVTIGGKPERIVQWEVLSDINNHTYIHCIHTGSKAYFQSNNIMFYFTWFEGNKDSLLFLFYLGAYQVAKGYYRNLVITDTYPLKVHGNGLIKVLQDFVAPFFFFIHADYRMQYQSMGDELEQRQIKLQSEARNYFFRKDKRFAQVTLYIDNDQINRFEVRHNGNFTIATLTQSSNL